MNFFPPPNITETKDWILSGWKYGIFECINPEISQEILNFYTIGDILVENTPIECVMQEYAPSGNLRFFIISSKFANFGVLNPGSFHDVFHIELLNVNSHFRVLDIQDMFGVKQIVLLHFPFRCLDNFSGRKTLKYGDDAKDFFEEIRELSRHKLKESFTKEKFPEKLLQEERWKYMHLIPLGLDFSNGMQKTNLRPLFSLSQEEKYLYSALRKISGDTTEINQVYS